MQYLHVAKCIQQVPSGGGKNAFSQPTCGVPAHQTSLLLSISARTCWGLMLHNLSNLCRPFSPTAPSQPLLSITVRVNSSSCSTSQYPCWMYQSSYWPFSLACQDHPEWQPWPSGPQLLNPVSHSTHLMRAHSSPPPDGWMIEMFYSIKSQTNLICDWPPVWAWLTPTLSAFFCSSTCPPIPDHKAPAWIPDRKSVV